MNNQRGNAKAKGNIKRVAAINRRDNAKRRAKKRGYVTLNATLEEIEQAL